MNLGLVGIRTESIINVLQAWPLSGHHGTGRWVHARYSIRAGRPVSPLTTPSSAQR
jgi:hypothetical protein